MSDEELHTLPYVLWTQRAGDDYAIKASHFSDSEIALYVAEVMRDNSYFSDAYVTDRAGVRVEPQGVPQ